MVSPASQCGKEVRIFLKAMGLIRLTAPTHKWVCLACVRTFDARVCDSSISLNSEFVGYSANLEHPRTIQMHHEQGIRFSKEVEHTFANLETAVVSQINNYLNNNKLNWAFGIEFTHVLKGNSNQKSSFIIICSMAPSVRNTAIWWTLTFMEYDNVCAQSFLHIW